MPPPISKISVYKLECTISVPPGGGGGKKNKKFYNVLWRKNEESARGGAATSHQMNAPNCESDSWIGWESGCSPNALTMHQNAFLCTPSCILMHWQSFSDILKRLVCFTPPLEGLKLCIQFSIQKFPKSDVALVQLFKYFYLENPRR